MKICLPCAMSWGVFLGVDAEICDIAPHISCATFALHKKPLTSQWTVTNIESGQAIETADSRIMAIKYARLRMLTKTNAEVERAIKKSNRKTRDYPFSGYA